MPIQKTTREEIIKNSIKVFRRKGYYRTSMSDLAKEAGLTKGAFYHHFNDKEEVMRKSLQATIKWFEKRVFSIAYEEGPSNEEKIVKMGEVIFQAFTQGDGGCFFANTILETAHVEDTFTQEIKHYFKLWEKALQNMLKDKYSGSEIEEMAERMIADIEGSIILMQLYKDYKPLQKALKRSALSILEK